MRIFLEVAVDSKNQEALGQEAFGQEAFGQEAGGRRQEAGERNIYHWSFNICHLSLADALALTTDH